MGGRDHACEVCGRGGLNDPDGRCVCPSCLCRIDADSYPDHSCREMQIECEDGPGHDFVDAGGAVEICTNCGMERDSGEAF